MSAGKSTRAAGSPRASTPKDGRPWYAPRPRWFADDVGPGLLMRREPRRYVVREIARCNSTYRAEQLAAALNREEKQQAELAELRAGLAAGLDEVDALRAALARLADACGSSSRARISPALEKARRVLGARTFKPGGEEVGRD